MGMGKLAAAVAIAVGSCMAATADVAEPVGSIEAVPSSWKGPFFPEIHGLPGS